MAILPILNSLKGKVLDLAHIELIQHAYELQQENITQLKTNNEAIAESKALLREKTDLLEHEVERLTTENAAMLAELTELREKNAHVELSEFDIRLLKFLGQHDGEDVRRGDVHDSFRDIPKGEVNYHLDNLQRAGFAKTTRSLKGREHDRCSVLPVGRSFLKDHGLFAE